MNKLIDAASASELTGLSRGTFYSKPWRQRIGLQAIKLGRALRFRERDLQELIEQGAEQLGDIGPITAKGQR